MREQRGVQDVIIPYKPRPQLVEYHQRKQRWAIIVAHRRFGKTVGCINDLEKAALECTKREPRYAYVAPTFSQAKDVAWSYLKYYGLSVPGTKVNESELFITFPNSARIRLYGSDNYDRMRGIYLDGVVMDEYGDQDPRAWSEVIRPALSDRKGWGTFIGTPRGRNHFADLVEKHKKDPDWFYRLFKASETGLIDEAELSDARAHMSAEQYEAEYECSFSGSIIGAYYSRELDTIESRGQVTNVPWEPRSAVWVVWDLGIGDDTAIWFVQIVGGEIHVIDYLENNGVGLAWYVSELKNRPYTYAGHIFPHDIEVKELGTGVSRLLTLQSLEVPAKHTYHIISPMSVDEGINAVRMILPRCWFDVDRTRMGLEALRNYKRKWDEKRKVFMNTPFHDWASHAADSFRYFAIGFDLIVGSTSWSKKINYKPKGVV